MNKNSTSQIPLFPTADVVPAPSTVETETEAEVRRLRRRVRVLETWVRMVEGQVTGPMSALPTLEEAQLQTPPDPSPIGRCR
ncbi:MAG: hypothetical protein EBU84_21775 [Actinobacteria bacterium]|nr:hypothetical protein [Actinomycetota bacterium]